MLRICERCSKKEPLCHLECKVWHQEQSRLAYYRAELWYKKTRKFFGKHRYLTTLLFIIVFGWIIWSSVCAISVIIKLKM